jgi:hypothetical protein
MVWLIIVFAIGVMLGGFLMVRRQMRAMNPQIGRARRTSRPDDSYVATTTPLVTSGSGGHSRAADPDGPATGTHHGHAGAHHGGHGATDSSPSGGDSGGGGGGGGGDGGGGT